MDIKATLTKQFLVSLSLLILAACSLALAESTFDQVSKRRRTEHQLSVSLAIPAFILGGLGGGGSNPAIGINNGNLPNYNVNSNLLSSSSSNSLSFNLPTNILRQATVTTTVLQTVTTVTVPIFRTCTTTAAQLSACVAPPRKARTEHIRQSNTVNYDKEPPESFRMNLIIDSTTIQDPAIMSSVLEQNEFHPLQEDFHSSDNDKEIFQFQLDPSEDQSNNGQQIEATQSLQDEKISRTPRVPEHQGMENPGKGRLGFPRTSTVTRTLPVVAVVNSTVTENGGQNNMAQVLTVSYLGCLPSSLPITTTAC